MDPSQTWDKLLDVVADGIVDCITNSSQICKNLSSFWFPPTEGTHWLKKTSSMLPWEFGVVSTIINSTKTITSHGTKLFWFGWWNIIHLHKIWSCNKRIPLRHTFKTSEMPISRWTTNWHKNISRCICYLKLQSMIIKLMGFTT